MKVSLETIFCVFHDVFLLSLWKILNLSHKLHIVVSIQYNQIYKIFVLFVFDYPGGNLPLALVQNQKFTWLGAVSGTEYSADDRYQSYFFFINGAVTS